MDEDSILLAAANIMEEDWRRARNEVHRGRDGYCDGDARKSMDTMHCSRRARKQAKI